MEILLYAGLILTTAVVVWVISNKNNRSDKWEGYLREISDLKSRLSVLEVEKRSLEEAKSQLQLEKETLVKSCEVQFENIANKIFHQQSVLFKENNKTEINHIIEPLNRHLQDFRRKIEEQNERQSEDKAALSHQVTRVIQANEKIQEITSGFVNSIRLEPSVRGVWGEDTLRRLLTDCGLQENVNFFQQVTSDNDKRPDFIVLLPNGQMVIIDAKTIFVHYDKYIRETDSEKKAVYLKEHISDIKKTITQLATKKYREGIEKYASKLGVSVPDDPVSLVLMFVHPEAALACALEQAPSIVKEAKEQQVALVSGATLISALQIINVLWDNHNIEEQNQEIRRLAESLVTDFASFLSDFTQMGKHLRNAQSHYEGSLQKVGENNTKGLIRTAQELANICPSGDVSKGDKKILRETGYDGTKKMQTLSDNSTTI